MFRKLRLRDKILVPSLATVVVVLVALGFFVTRKVSSTISEETNASVTELARRYGAELTAEIGAARETAETLANAAEGLKAHETAPSRSLVVEIQKRILETNGAVSGVWTVWEPDAFDGLDSENHDQPHSDARGRFIPYLSRQSGIHLERSKGYADPGRGGEPYRQVIRTGVRDISEPYFVEMAGNRLLMISVLAPITFKGRRVGVAGVDFTLDEFSNRVSAIRPYSIGYALVVSTEGVIVAHPDRAFVGRKLIEVAPSKDIVAMFGAIKAGESKQIRRVSPYNRELSDFFFVPIQVKESGVPWCFAVSVPVRQVQADSRQVLYFIMGVGVLALLVIGGTIFLISRDAVRPIEELSKAADEISRGALERQIPELEGNEFGKLGDSLRAMVGALKEYVSLSEEKSWLSAGTAEMAQAIRGEQSIEQIAEMALKLIVNQIGIDSGGFWLVNADGSGARLYSGYAYPGVSKERELRVGDGLVGEAWASRKTILLNDIPEDQWRIHSGFGEILPKAVLAFPVEFEDRVLGVIELAKLVPFRGQDPLYVERVREGIGVALHAALSRIQLRDLLNKSQNQTERLQVQQEELAQTNEELQEQTRALRISEQALQVQQEELRVANEELEERNRALEVQRDMVRGQNAGLEEAMLELERRAKDLDLANRYKSEFLANMSHELRTPLNSILILSQILGANKEGNLEAKQVEFCKTIHSSGTDLLNLINDVLDLAKVESGRMAMDVEAVNLVGLGAAIEQLFSPQALAKQLEFQLLVDPGLPAVIQSDQQRLMQVIKNLLSNAIKFTDSGKVTLRIRRPVERELLPRVTKIEDGVAFEVTDTGIGIPKDMLEPIFEAFRQVDGSTSRKYGGTGLGLSIARELSRALGGDIYCESEIGRGSQFSLVVPLECPVEPPAPMVERIREQPKPAVETPERIPPGAELEHVRDDRREIKPGDKILLIIEDDPAFAEILRDLIRERGFRCLIAGDGETGLHFADYYLPNAIILDVGLPGMDGYAVMARLKQSQRTRPIPVHFISASDNSLQALRMGAVGFLTKPVSLERLTDAMERIEKLLARTVKRLLVVEDDPIQQQSIIELVRGNDLETVAVSTGEDAFRLLSREIFDCMILDLGLGDLTGIELLERIRSSRQAPRIPVIVYTGRDLSREEEAILQRYSDSIIIKGARSPERLLDETTLFLHRIESGRPCWSDQAGIGESLEDQGLAGKKVLVVDDDMRNVFALASVLEERGLTVVEASNGKEALAKLDEHPDIDLVLMDIMMPEMDGYEAMRAIRDRERWKKLPVIALTAKAMKGDRAKCIEAGASDYLAKPVDIGKLISLIRVWLY